MGENIEQIAVLRLDDLLHLSHLRAAEAFFGEALQQLRTRVGRAPQFAQFGFAFEELRKFAEQHLQKLLRRHRRAVGVPETCHHHVLDGARLSVREPDLILWRRVRINARVRRIRFGMRL